MDILRRQIAERRVEDEVEAEGLAAAILAVEQAEQREAMEFEEHQRLQEEAQRQEALETARLRRISEIEETRKRREAEERRIVKISNQFFNLRAKLGEIHMLQRRLLQERHDDEEQQVGAEFKTMEESGPRRIQDAITAAENNHQGELRELSSTHCQQISTMDMRHEEEEDDYFLGIRAHLRGKPNREARERAAVEKVKKTQAEERDELLAKQEVEMMSLAERHNTDESVNAEHEHELEMSQLKNVIETGHRRRGAEMEIFRKVSEFRREILRELEQRNLESGTDISAPDSEAPNDPSLEYELDPYRPSSLKGLFIEEELVSGSAHISRMISRRHPLSPPRSPPAIPGAFPVDEPYPATSAESQLRRERSGSSLTRASRTGYRHSPLLSPAEPSTSYNSYSHDLMGIQSFGALRRLAV
ncbi:MAG: hypothetical protein M4579_006392 [Chaenotheca gracillima]|nr:MAG: hypothetical protein M4579_006392 [Chaenotheca gracillima]